MIHLECPQGFNPVFEVSSCIIHRDDQTVLMLQRLPNKSEGNKWGLPAGKVEKSETPLLGVIREVAEETGIILNPEKVELFKTVYVRYPEIDFIYHMFHSRATNTIDFKIKPDEHQSGAWIPVNELMKLNLVLDQDSCFDLYFMDCLNPT